MSDMGLGYIDDYTVMVVVICKVRNVQCSSAFPKEMDRRWLDFPKEMDG